LRIGPHHQPYFVPEILLQSLRDLPFSESAERTIDLPDVDAETGHVIVHFLYTSQYQTLPDIEEESGPSYSRAGFKKAISAFIAAKNYKLTALQELARNEVHKCGENIGVAQAAHGIGKDTLSALQEDALWLQDLIMQKAEQAFANNDDIFSSNSFFSGIKSHKLAKLLGQHVAKLYHSRVEELSRGSSELKPSTPNQEVEKIDASSSMAPANEVYADMQAAHLPPEVETSADDWGFGLSKKQRKQKAARIAEEGWGTSWSTWPQAEPEPAMETVTEPAVETVLIEDAPPIIPDPVEETAEFTIDRADAEDPWGILDGAKKKKKKKKKSQVTASGEEAPGIEPETLSTAENRSVTDPVFSRHSSMNNAHGESTETPAEVVNDPVLEPAAAIEDSPVIVEPPPTNEQHDQWGIWGASLGSSKKKKKKKDKAVQIEVSPPPPLSPSPPPADSDPVANEDFIEPELPSEPEREPPAPELEEMPEEAPGIHESESHAEAAYDGTVSADMESPNDIWCLSRYKHLTLDDQWRNCQQCKSYINMIAMKVQHEKHMSMEFRA
jgi:hypothetical protein